MYANWRRERHTDEWMQHASGVPISKKGSPEFKEIP
jgi:hypothetical protein